MLGFYLKMSSWVEGKLSTTRSQNSGFQLLVFGGGGGWWCILQESWVQPWRNVWLLWMLLFFPWVKYSEIYLGFAPSASHVQLQPQADRSGRRKPSRRLVCAASSEKPSAGGDLDLGILSSTCKDLDFILQEGLPDKQSHESSYYTASS